MTAKTRLVDAVKAVVDPVTGGIELSAGGDVLPVQLRGNNCSFPSYTDTRFQDSSTPTLFFDPTATGSTGVGTLDNPCTTWVQVNTAIAAIQANGVVPGTVLGIKTGINWRMNTQGNAIRLSSIAAGSAGSTKIIAGGNFTNLFKIVPYGSSSELPILNGLMILTGWADEGGGIYSRDMSTENPSTALSLPLWENGVRLKKSAVDGRTRAQTLTDLASAGAGYYYSCLDSEKKLYVYPNSVSSLESGAMETTGVSRVLNIQYPDYRMTGFISVSGIEMRGALDTNLLIQPLAITNLSAAAANSSVSDISVYGIKTGYVGADTNLSQGSADGLNVFGATNAIRVKNLYIGGISAYDVFNNSIELNGVQAGIVEYVNSDKSSGKMVEKWSSCSNVVTRYSKCTNHTAQNTKATNFASAFGDWTAGNTLTSGSALTSSADTAVSLNNTTHHCILEADTPFTVGAGSGHKVHHNTCKTLSGALAGSGYQIANGCTGADVSNNLVIAGNANSLAWVRTGVTGLTGDHNCYVFDGRAANATLFMHAVSTPIAGASTGLNAISWYQALAAWTAAITAGSYGANYDVNSTLVNGAPSLNVNYLPPKGHPAVEAGKALTPGYIRDIYGNVISPARPCAGAVEIF